MTYDEWFATYQPRANFIDPNAPFDGFMWEIDGHEFDQVDVAPPENVWTIMDTDEGLVLTPGRHFVDRFGYFICEFPFIPTEDQPWIDIPISLL